MQVLKTCAISEAHFVQVENDYYEGEDEMKEKSLIEKLIEKIYIKNISTRFLNSIRLSFLNSAKESISIASF